MTEQLEHASKTLGIILGVLAASTAVIVAILKLFDALDEVRKRLGPMWNRLQKPLLTLLIYLTTVVIPNGLMVWMFMYVAAQNTDRIRQPIVFLLLTLELTAAISLYTVFWSLWLYPKLRPWLQRHARHITGSSAENPPENQEQVSQPSPESKGGAS